MHIYGRRDIMEGLKNRRSLVKKESRMKYIGIAHNRNRSTEVE